MGDDRAAVLRDTVSRRFLLFPAVLLVLVLWVSDSWHQMAAEELELYPADAPIDATLLRLDRMALDEAYKDHVQKLFGVWVSQQAKDARPISNGLAIARRAYRHAKTQITKREQELLERQERLDGAKP